MMYETEMEINVLVILIDARIHVNICCFSHVGHRLLVDRDIFILDLRFQCTKESIA